MDTPRPDVYLGFTRKKYPAGTHMCFIYDSEAERDRTMARFLIAGVERGERVAYFADRTIAQASEWLEDAGLASSPADLAGQVQLSVAQSVYCPGGFFDPEIMLEGLRRFGRDTDASGYPGGRISGEMAWALRGLPGSERLPEYEAKVNNVLPGTGMTAICQYDANRWDGETILHVLRVHPMMVVRGQVLENPYYMNPEEYLSQYAPRRRT
jgi:hypothetical protein